MATAEILPGVHHWTARHPHGFIVSSYWLDEGGVAIDPLLPEEGVEWFAQRAAAPSAVVLSNRHHYRHSGALNDRFTVPVLVPASGLHEFTHDEPVVPYEPGDTLPGGLLALEVGVLCPDECALYLEPLRALWIADSVVRRFTPGTKPGFVVDSLMDDPPATKQGLLRALAAILDDHDVEHVLMAHGPPMLHDGGEQLREFIASGGRTATDAFAT